VADHGIPAADAVVSVRSEENDNLPLASPAPTTKTIDQRDETFLPYVEIFRPGDSVVFRNSDTTRHHVYSFSPIRSFEFVIAPGHSAPAVLLDRVGDVAVGCNIHDHMITHLYISDAPWIARSGADGRVVFDDLPAGKYSVQAWHPQLRPARAPPPQTVVVGAVARSDLAFSLTLLPDPRQDAGDRERSRY
jgi:plastocyanin